MMPDPANSNAEHELYDSNAEHELYDSNAEHELYDMRRDEEGWTIYNVRTGEPASVNGVRQTGLNFANANAGDLAILLKQLALQKGGDASI